MKKTNSALKVEKNILKKEKKIEAEIKRIERMEKVIKNSENKISKNLSLGIKNMSKGGINSTEASLIKRSLLRKVSKHKFIFTTIVTLGIVLVWRGLWDISQFFIKDSLIALGIGVVILWLLEKYTDL